MFKELGIIPKIPLMCIQNNKQREKNWKTHLTLCLSILSVSCSVVLENSGIERTVNLFPRSSICEIMPRRIKGKMWTCGFPVQTGNQSLAMMSVKVYRCLTGLYMSLTSSFTLLLFIILASWRSFWYRHGLSSHTWPFVIVTLWGRNEMWKPWGRKPWMFDAGWVTEGRKGEQILLLFVTRQGGDSPANIKLQRKTGMSVSDIDMKLERMWVI